MSETRRSPRTAARSSASDRTAASSRAPVQEVGDPDREAVDDDQIEPAAPGDGRSPATSSGSSTVSHSRGRSARCRAMRSRMSPSEVRAVATNPVRADRRAAEGDGVSALAAAGAAENEMRLVQ